MYLRKKLYFQTYSLINEHIFYDAILTLHIFFIITIDLR